MVLLCPQPLSFPISSAYSTPPVKAGFLAFLSPSNINPEPTAGRGSDDWPCCAKGCHGCRDSILRGERGFLLHFSR